MLLIGRGNDGTMGREKDRTFDVENELLSETSHLSFLLSFYRFRVFASLNV
jgi:hypothetical protein